MTTYIHGTCVTAKKVASNNLGESDGNFLTIQKVWDGDEKYSTVSGDAIRFAVRRRFVEIFGAVRMNRIYNSDTRENDWKDLKFDAWFQENKTAAQQVFVDDDILGFVKQVSKGTLPQGRKSALEVSRAISMSPYKDDNFNYFTSSGATPGAATAKMQDAKKSAPTPRTMEAHLTRYLYSFSLNVDHIKSKPQKETAINVVESLMNIGPVAGSNSRNLYDFSPESCIIRIAEDPSLRTNFLTEENGVVNVNKFINFVKNTTDNYTKYILAGDVVNYINAADTALLTSRKVNLKHDVRTVSKFLKCFSSLKDA
jgi:CRISPR-associated protein Cst2